MLPSEGREKGDTTWTHTHAHTRTHSPAYICRNILKGKIYKKTTTEIESVEALGIRSEGGHAHNLYFLEGVL